MNIAHKAYEIMCFADIFSYFVAVGLEQSSFFFVCVTQSRFTFLSFPVILRREPSGQKE